MEGQTATVAWKQPNQNQLSQSLKGQKPNGKHEANVLLFLSPKIGLYKATVDRAKILNK